MRPTGASQIAAESAKLSAPGLARPGDGRGILLQSRQIAALNGGMRLSYYCWNPEDRHKPPLLLTHGTGFVAATFIPLARRLQTRFRVYAYDRRGHGRSDKPEAAYELTDFADDCAGFCQALGLEDAYAVGHSAGGTDLLLAESRQPGLFRKIFVMEPTVDDPRRGKCVVETVHARVEGDLAQARRRRHRFPSRTHVLERYRDKPLFRAWDPAALEAYIADGFFDRADGSVELQCSPKTESRILRPIFLTFHNAEHDDQRGNPFVAMDRVVCPVAVSHSALSDAIYHTLAERAVAHLPHARRVRFEHAGHCVPQEAPDALAEAVLGFWQDAV